MYFHTTYTIFCVRRIIEDAIYMYVYIFCRFFLMFRVFREEIKKSDIKYRIPSPSPERLNVDGVYQTFKTLRTVNQCLFTSILYIQVNTIKVTILRKKKI